VVFVPTPQGASVGSDKENGAEDTEKK